MDTPDDMSWGDSSRADSPSSHVMTEDFEDESQECPSCGSRNSTIDEWETTICTGCGLVLEESPVVIRESDTIKYQLKKVDAQGRPGSTAVYCTPGRVSHSAYTKDREAIRKKFLDLRSHQAKKAIEAAGRLVQSTTPIMDRAFHLWKAVYGKWQVMAGDHFDCMALSCLYVVSKEMNKGVSLIRLASVSNQSHLRIGAVFKRVSKVLQKHKLIDLDKTVYSNEDSHWIELTRLLELRRDEMPKALQETFGPSTDSRTRLSQLKEILIVSQKVLAIVIESGVATGRQVSGIVAACVVLALQYHLKSKTSRPAGLMEWAIDFFMVTDTRIKLQMREVEFCMIDWIKRLPYVPKKRFKPSEIVDYMDEVFGYFQNFHADNQTIWNAVDRLVIEGEEEEESYEAEEEDDDPLEAGTPVPDQDIDLLEENLLVDEVPELLQAAFRAGLEATRGDKTEVDRAAVFLPRSFKASERRRARQQKRLHIAKESLGLVTKNTSEDARPRIKAQDEMVKHMKILLKLGTRTEQELVDASPDTLAYWAKQDAAPLASDHDLDAKELSDKDLPEEEWQHIVRTDQERDIYWRVMGPDIVLGEAINKRNAEYNEWKIEYKKRKKDGMFVDIRQKSVKAKAKNARPKSSRLNYAALEELRREEEEEEEEREAILGKSAQGVKETLQGAIKSVQETIERRIEPEDEEEEDEDKEDEKDYEEEDYGEYADQHDERAYEWEMEEY